MHVRSDGVKMTELCKRYSTKLIMAESDAEFEAIWTEAMEAYDKLKPEAYIVSSVQFYLDNSIKIPFL